MGQRMHWRDDEWEAIIREATPIILEQPKVSIIQAVQMVQDRCIEPDRRRPLPNIGSIRADIRSRLEQLRNPSDTVPTERYKELENRYHEANQRIKSLLADNAGLQATIQSLHANKPKEPMQIIKEFFADVMADALIKQQKETVPPVIIKAPDPKPETTIIPKHNCEPEPAKGLRKPKVVLIGGSPERHVEINREFGNELELRFFHGSREQGRLGDQLRAFKDRSHGKILIWGDYCGHSVERALEFENIPFERFKGQFALLKARLHKIVNGGGPPR